MEEGQQQKICRAEQRKLFRLVQPPAPNGKKKPSAHIKRRSGKRGVVPCEKRARCRTKKRREGSRAHQPCTRHGSGAKRRRARAPCGCKQKRKRRLKRARSAEGAQARQHRRLQPLKRFRHGSSLPNALCMNHDICLSPKSMPNQCDKNARILQCSAGYILRSKAFAVRLCLWYSFTRTEQSYCGTPALKHPLCSRKPERKAHAIRL